ncbi:MAG: xylulokinase [Oscillospiraceae bacterium]
MSVASVHIIESGEAVLGLELGSTRIKAVLIGPDHTPLASGSHQWENRFENNLWTYTLEDIWNGVRAAYKNLQSEVQLHYGVSLKKLGAMGVSGMMHGYFAFDRKSELLVPFRTWRNTSTKQAAELLTRLFSFNIPQRWSIAHLYQAILNREEHIKNVYYITTLAGYVHWMLTGQKVVGVGEASGMFPIDSTTKTYNQTMLLQFSNLIAGEQLGWGITSLLPAVLDAGSPAGTLTAEGARMLDESGVLQPGVPLCPPEGDAGTGMVATNSISAHTGNVSAGTSIFSMVVLDKPLSAMYPEIDMVTTPAGLPVAMVHCNNCTTELDDWVDLFGEALTAMGTSFQKPALYDAVYTAALKADADTGRLVSINYHSGEPITELEEGRPLFVRMPNSRLNFPNFCRNLLFSAMATLKIGMDLLTEKENVELKLLLGHGGLFKTPEVGQRFMAGALGVPTAVMESAGEGGPWGMALLAAYMKNRRQGEALETYLAERIFSQAAGKKEDPRPEDVQSFAAYMELYRQALMVEKAAVAYMR